MSRSVIARLLSILLATSCVTACSDDDIACPPGYVLATHSCVAGSTLDAGADGFEVDGGYEVDAAEVDAAEQPSRPSFDPGDPDTPPGLGLEPLPECADQPEVCNGLDDDCDGVVDEDAMNTYYRDVDGDGFGDPDSTCLGCSLDDCALHVANALDCDDTCDTCWTERAEDCDGVDNDCDLAVDEGARSAFLPDLDGDGFGAGEEVVACTAPEGYVLAPETGDLLDCADSDARAHPGATDYYETPIEGSATSFDFNCDGLPEPSVLATGNEASDCLVACDTHSRWADRLPVCGVKARMFRCMGVGAGCRAVGSAVFPRCR